MAILVGCLFAQGLPAQLLSMDQLQQSLAANKTLPYISIQTSGKIDPALKKDADFFIAQFSSAFQTAGAYAASVKADPKVLASMVQSYKDRLNFESIDEYLVKYPADRFAIALNKAIKTAGSSEQLVQQLQKIKIENSNQERVLYIYYNLVPVVKKYTPETVGSTDPAAGRWWSIFKCVAGTIGGALGGGLAGCVGVAGVGATVGTLGGPAGTAAGAIGGCVGGGIVGAIGGGLSGAAQYCGN